VQPGSSGDEPIKPAMTDTTKLNTLTEPLITLAIPALILMKLSDTEQLGVVQELMLASTFPLVWGMRDVIRRKKPVILICRTGNRTSTLARHLVEHMGYTQVYNVRDGITRWIRDGQPVIRVQPSQLRDRDPA
jgi:rhodanese-related sulfurtransferase